MRDQHVQQRKAQRQSSRPRIYLRSGTNTQRRKQHRQPAQRQRLGRVGIAVNWQDVAIKLVAVQAVADQRNRACASDGN